MAIKLLLIVLTSLSCGYRFTKEKVSFQQQENICCIRVYREFPIIDLKGDVVRYDPFESRIYFWKHQVMYQTYHYHAISNTPEEAENPDYKYVYYSFIYSPGKEKGVLCDSANLLSKRVVPVDSMLLNEWAAKTNFDFLFKESNATLISTTVNPSGEKEDVYSFVGKKDSTMTGRFTLNYCKNKFEGINYSFSRELDSVNNMKLYKVVVVNDARYLPGSTFHIDKLTIPYTLEEIPVANEAEILKLFDLESKTVPAEK